MRSEEMSVTDRPRKRPKAPQTHRRAEIYRNKSPTDRHNRHSQPHLHLPRTTRQLTTLPTLPLPLFSSLLSLPLYYPISLSPFSHLSRVVEFMFGVLVERLQILESRLQALLFLQQHQPVLSRLVFLAARLV